MFLLLCIVIILLEELLALSRVTVGGNVKAGGELLACLCTCITTGHHTLPLASCTLLKAGAVLEQCVRPIFQLPCTLHIASWLLQIQWRSTWCWPPMQESKRLGARAMEAFE